MTDEEQLDVLVPAIRRGEPAAFSAVYDLMAEQLLAFATGHLGDPHAAEDVVQETFLRLARNAEDFRGAGRGLLSWLYTTARRVCIDVHRHRATRPESLTPVLPETDVAPEPVPSVTITDPDLATAMATLTESQRTALVLRRVVGLAGEEVGRVMHLDRDAVYALCRRAEAALRRALAASEPSEPAGAGRPTGRRSAS